MVLGRGADHGGATDVDVLDAGIEIGALRDSRLERVEVHDQKIDWADGVRRHRRGMFLVITNGEEGAVHARMQGLHPPVHHFGKAGEIRDIERRSPASASALRVPPVDTSSTPWHASARANSTSSRLVGHGNKRAKHAHVIRHEGPPSGPAFGPVIHALTRGELMTTVRCSNTGFAFRTRTLS